MSNGSSRIINVARYDIEARVLDLFTHLRLKIWSSGNV